MTQLTGQLAALPPSRRAALLARLRAGEPDRDDEIPRTDPSHVEAPLTAAQRSLWFVEQLNPGTPTYNLPQYLRLRGPLNVDALRRALGRVVERHEALRSLLLDRDSGPVQVILPQVLVDVAVHDAVGRTIDDVLNEADRVYGRSPLPLDRPPLWRAGLYRTAPDEHLFVFVVHHAIFDGLSFAVFDRDLAAFYSQECGGSEARLPNLPARYSDFARWQVGRLSGDRLRVLKDFWRSELGDAETVDLPTDRPRSAKPTGAGSVATGRVPADVCAAVRELSRQRRTTVFVVCLAAFWVLLHRRTGARDVVVGSSTAGRNHAAVANSIGYFVNVVALRGRFADGPTFAELVDRATRCITETLAHGDLGFEEVVRAVAPDRGSGKSPLFQVSFAVGGGQAGPQLAGLDVEPLPMHHGTARFDMAWGLNFGDHADVGVEYSTELFDRQHVEGLIAEYSDILRELTRSPENPASSQKVMEQSRYALLGSDARPAATDTCND
ncbi:condensation domain-containing protein [Kribbella endophytica]